MKFGVSLIQIVCMRYDGRVQIVETFDGKASAFNNLWTWRTLRRVTPMALQHWQLVIGIYGTSRSTLVHIELYSRFVLPYMLF